jgi:hypothetical protein
VRAVNLAVSMQNFQILANRDLRSLEAVGEFPNQNPTLSIQEVEDCAAAFFVQHSCSRSFKTVTKRKIGTVLFRITFYSVCFRLSNRTSIAIPRKGRNQTGITILIPATELRLSRNAVLGSLNLSRLIEESGMSRGSGEVDCGLSSALEQQRFVRTRSVVSRVIAGETLIVPVRGKVGDLASIYSFNGTGTLLWQLLDAPRSLAELVDAVEHQYDVAREQAEKDVTRFLNDLALMDLLETRVQPTQIETQIRRVETPASTAAAGSPAGDSHKQAASMAR